MISFFLSFVPAPHFTLLYDPPQTFQNPDFLEELRPHVSNIHFSRDNKDWLLTFFLMISSVIEQNITDTRYKISHTSDTCNMLVLWIIYI